MTKKKTVALFDFDGTLIRGSSSLAFLRYFLGWRYYLYFIYLFPIVVLYSFRILNLDRVSTIMYTACLKGYHRNELEKPIKNFTQNILPLLYRKEALDRFHWHKERGDLCILVTASCDIYVIPWARQQKFDDVLCTKLQFDAEDRVTGKLDGLTCSGAEKLRRIKELINHEDYVIYAYGDTDGDKEMLEYADYPFFRKFE